jgi:hypothetical protein
MPEGANCMGVESMSGSCARAVCMVVASALMLASVATAAEGQSISSVTTKFDSKRCRHTPGRDAEDYGSWRCTGHDGIAVRLSAGDQRMQVSFGQEGGREVAARQTFPAFNSVYEGTIEWRLERRPNSRPRPFATILRWNVRREDDGRDSTGRVLVVTRLNPGGVCHVGYVDTRANQNANELARQIADELARTFQCGKDKPVVRGQVSAGLSMPRND